MLSGLESWNGTLRPGESQYISCTCRIPGGTRALPPLTVAYDDGTGPRGITVPETPILVLHELSALTVYLAGLIAGINPCLLAVMAFIGTTTIADTGHRTAVLIRIVAFSGGMLAVYLLIGIGLMQLIDRLPIMSALLKVSIILLLIVLAGWSFFDAWQTRKGRESTALKSILGRIRPFYIRYGLIASFAIGSIFGLVKMPCVGGIYIAILGTILDNGEAARGLALLLVYNLGVVTPVLLLGTLITVGLSPATVNQFRLRHRVELKIFTGILLAIMAVAFLIGAM
jgi:cytochrome c biogenesis protein CcdA